MPRSTRPRWLSAALILPLLTGCSHPDTAQTVPVAASPEVDICEAWLQLNIRAGDRLTNATAEEFVKLNAGREALGCPYEKPVRTAQK